MNMDHVVYVDTKSKELEKLLDGSKTMIIRGAAGRKLPYGRVNVNDILFFIRNNGEGLIKAKTIVKNVYNSKKLDKEESIKLVEDNQPKLRLSDTQIKRWAGKRYLVLIEIDKTDEIDYFKIDRSNYGNMDDWLPVEDIHTVKK